MVAEVTRKINEVVAHHLAPALKKAGFKRTGQRFRKPFEQYTWVVEVRRDKYNIGDEGSFTVHLGVYHPAWIKVTQEVERARRIMPPLSDEPDVSDCMTNESLGFVLGQTDDWREINERTSVEQVGTAVVAAILDKGIEWLEAMSPLEAAVSALSAEMADLSGAWLYKIEAMFGWVALGNLAQATRLYKAASGDVITHQEMEREFGAWARGRGMDIGID